MEVFQQFNPENYSIHLIQKEDTRYREICDFVCNQYKQHFNCDLRHFMPNHLVLQKGDAVMAVAGFRNASTGPLFLEQYLDEPVEDLLLEKMNQFRNRDEIVEVGGFAAVDRLSALQLMLHLSAQLNELEYKTLVCAANKPIQQCLKRSGFSWVVLGEARADRVSQQENDWGSYYRSKPALLAGNIPQSEQQLVKRVMRERVAGATV